MNDHGLCPCGYPSGYTRRLEDELMAAQLRIQHRGGAMSDELWSELRNELLAEIADLENAMANMPPGALLTRASAEARIGAARSVLTIIDRETSPPSRPTIAAVENALRAVKALESECDRDAANAFGVLVAHADRIAAERDAWSEEAGRRGLELATVKAKYAALLEVCAEFAHGNREGM